jgi:hypothetical protein
MLVGNSGKDGIVGASRQKEGRIESFIIIGIRLATLLGRHPCLVLSEVASPPKWAGGSTHGCCRWP